LQCCYREQLAYNLYARFREPKLYRMAVKGDWDEIPARCNSHPKEAAFRHKYAPYDTALHRLLRPAEMGCLGDLDETTLAEMDKMRYAAVQALLAAHRPAATLQDAFGRTPLHLACMDWQACGIETIAALVEANPKATTIVDVEKRTPLHFLVARHESIPVELLQLLMTYGPEAVSMEDAVRETPLDIVERRKDEMQSTENILELLQSVPKESRRRESDQTRATSRSFSEGSK